MKVLFEELRLHVGRQGFHGDRFTYDEFRAFLMERVAITDDERTAKGPPKNLDHFVHGNQPPEFDQGPWLEDENGERSWPEPAQLNALSNGNGKGKGKGNGKGKGCRNGGNEQFERN